MENKKRKLESPSLYTIGWIAALSIEQAAARALLDEEHAEPQNFRQPQSDSNNYLWGRIGPHNIVIASLPAGVYGVASAATTATDLVRSLPQIRFGLLVGIGGAISRPDDQDIRLGDVVVGLPDGVTGGVVQYDLGKAKANGVWEPKGSLDKPPAVLLKALASLQAEHEIREPKIPQILDSMLEANPGMTRPRTNFSYQGAENDHLFESGYDHIGGKTCKNCDTSREVDREERDTTEPEIHYGVIASGNTLIKDAALRDMLAKFTGHKCLCVEMEAAGLVDRFPCLVIRGICDYADSHKNDQWQRYAAATATAFAVELLSYVPVRQVEESQQAIEILQSLEHRVDDLSHTIHKVDYQLGLDKLPFVEGAPFNSYAEEHGATCLPETRVQLLQEIDQWITNPKSKTIFWLNGMAGTGKSTISRTVSRTEFTKGRLGATFFFKRGETDRGNMSKLVPTLAHQLAMYVPGISNSIREAVDADASIAGKTLGEQFEKLIKEPIMKISASPSSSGPLVMVIDALDECQGETHIKQLLSLFSRVGTPEYFCLRVFITSRPELPIQLGFLDIEGTYQDVELHRVASQTIKHDIAVYLRHELEKVRKNSNRILRLGEKRPLRWPGEDKFDQLVCKTQPLFIAAATVCRFINDTALGDPEDLLDKVLYSNGRRHMSHLHDIYLSILEQQVINRPESERQQVVLDFQLIVGTIITLASPLSIDSLASLLGVATTRIEGKVRLLESVLDVPKTIGAPVRMLHLSFRDYLVDPDQQLATPFWVDENATHWNLTKRCLMVMDSMLRENICGLPFPGTCPSEVKDFDPHKCITPALRPLLAKNCRCL
ncbi:hypothetical protein IL306_003289 [Fusarium sp. DS 682]|nr:hypothetical protein IL306_003289 [Fusarium sp. DS 682]